VVADVLKLSGGVAGRLLAASEVIGVLALDESVEAAA
jgi:hypothetical protein